MARAGTGKGHGEGFRALLEAVSLHLNRDGLTGDPGRKGHRAGGEHLADKVGPIGGGSPCSSHLPGDSGLARGVTMARDLELEGGDAGLPLRPIRLSRGDG